MGKKKSRNKSKSVDIDETPTDMDTTMNQEHNDSVFSQIDNGSVENNGMIPDVIDEIEESNPQLEMEIAGTSSDAFVVDDDDHDCDDEDSSTEELTADVVDIKKIDIENDSDKAVQEHSEIEEQQDRGITMQSTDVDSTASISTQEQNDDIKQVASKSQNNMNALVEPTEVATEEAEHQAEESIIQEENPTPFGISESVLVKEVHEPVEEPQLTLQPSPIDKYATKKSKINDSSETDQSTEKLFIPPVYKYIEHSNAGPELKKLTHDFAFSLCVVDFDHIKGPEIQYWIDDDLVNASESQREEINLEKISMYSKIWPHLPFEALPDGAHLFDETFTYFTLSYDAKWNRVVELPYDKLDTTDDPVINVNEAISNGAQIVELENPYETLVTLFGCGCIRQLDASELKIQDDNVKRGTIQKSVVLLSREPLPIQLREKLGVVTQSWFDQHEFKDYEILISLWNQISMYYNNQGYELKMDNLYDDIESPLSNSSEENGRIIRESDVYMGLNFQEVVLKLKRNLLILFKAIILGNYKILVFSKDLNSLSNIQYCLIGLIPTMLLSLQDSGFPLLDRVAQKWTKSSSLKSSDRRSILNFIGLPLPIFSKGSMFQPYMTLQQLDYLSNKNTESFIIGASNDILLERKNDWFDVVIYLDEQDGGLFSSDRCKVEFINRELKDITSLTSDDKKFIDLIINDVEKHYVTTNEDSTAVTDEEMSKNSKTVNHNPSIENGNYKGGDDFIRSQFEDYLIGMLSTIKYDQFLKRHAEAGNDAIFKQLGLDSFTNDIEKFNSKYITKFKNSRVGLHWDQNTEDELFNFFEPKHVGVDVARKENMFTQLFSKKSPITAVTNEQNEEDKIELTTDSSVPQLSNQLNSFGKEVGGFFKRLSAKPENNVDEAENSLVPETEANDSLPVSPEPENLTDSNDEVDVVPTATSAKLRGFFGW